MRLVFAALLVLHGVIHLPGFVKGVGLGDVPQLRDPITAREGWVWFAAALAFLAAATLWLLSSRQWPWVAAVAVLLSQALILRSWGDARAGTLVNLIVLIPTVLGIAEFRAGSLRSVFEREAAGLVANSAGAGPLVTDSDLADLPPVVQRYLRRVGVVGQPRVRNFHLTFDVQMRAGPDAPWFHGTAEQYEAFHPPQRLFYMKASRAGLPFDGLHRYVGDAATMDIRLLGLHRVQYLAGAEMTRSETVTLLNDICLLAPAALLEVPVTWDAIDERSVRARFTNAGHSVAAVLTFDAQGDLVNFTSEDRSRAIDGGMVRRPFATPVRRVGTMAGVRVVVDGDATYTEDGREWSYGRFVLTSLAYNVAAPR
ncbi:MAG: hypothetical protein JNJ98_06555 [Gemmatimonadetes bacterium]|nr:hypothetical protein [Gemmatimonadota bacterium]